MKYVTTKFYTNTNNNIAICCEHGVKTDNQRRQAVGFIYENIGPVEKK
jgi:hypothetical protein